MRCHVRCGTITFFYISITSKNTQSDDKISANLSHDRQKICSLKALVTLAEYFPAFKY